MTNIERIRATGFPGSVCATAQEWDHAHEGQFHRAWHFWLSLVKPAEGWTHLEWGEHNCIRFEAHRRVFVV